MAGSVVWWHRMQLPLVIDVLRNLRWGRHVGIQRQCSSGVITGRKLADLLSFSACASASYQRLSLVIINCRSIERVVDLQLSVLGRKCWSRMGWKRSRITRSTSWQWDARSLRVVFRRAVEILMFHFSYKVMGCFLSSCMLQHLRRQASSVQGVAF